MGQENAPNVMAQSDVANVMGKGSFIRRGELGNIKTAMRVVELEFANGVTFP